MATVVDGDDVGSCSPGLGSGKRRRWRLRAGRIWRRRRAREAGDGDLGQLPAKSAWGWRSCTPTPAPKSTPAESGGGGGGGGGCAPARGHVDGKPLAAVPFRGRICDGGASAPTMGRRPAPHDDHGNCSGWQPKRWQRRQRRHTIC
ncbi:Os06g0346000 [Oryza sativa Japonica Group]|uniref:Os06g0346000 protein n=1 Tax=Oryza sativa subsp. japonica TaxID=39947 RepID=A0A0P0WWL7_ORYSJ|nr:Os06g0346000 [Oryza sativa Japonica Group]